MDNISEAEFSILAYEGLVAMELIYSYGGVCNTYYYEFTFFMPEIQRMLTGEEDLRDYDGIHQFDFPRYVGVGRTMQDAWDNFNKVVEIDSIEELVEQIKDKE